MIKISDIIKKGNNDGKIELIQVSNEYDIVSKTKILLRSNSINTIIQDIITTMFIIGRKYIPFNALNKTFLQISMFSLLMVLPLFLVKQLPFSVYIRFLLEILVAGTIYLLLLMISRNEFLTMVFENVKKRIKK